LRTDYIDDADLSLLACRSAKKLHSESDILGALAFIAIVFIGSKFPGAETALDLSLPALLKKSQYPDNCFR
jgi:hypothetical protein